MRLTKENKGWHFPKRYEVKKGVSNSRVIHTLGRYEDSGFTPDELLLFLNPPKVLYIKDATEGKIIPIFPLDVRPLIIEHGNICWNCKAKFNDIAIIPLMGLNVDYFLTYEEADEYIRANQSSNGVFKQIKLKSKKERVVKMKKMSVNDYEVTFVVDAYADMFQRKAVLAFVASGDEKGELYGDVTINIPQYSLDEGESFLSSDCPDLIDAMVKNGYLEITDSVKLNYGTYKIGRFTQKFANEFEKTA